MKTAVLIKQVPDTETKITINQSKNGIVTDTVKYVINPYDEFAIEEAIKIGGESTVISLGPERCIEALRTALAMGIGKAVHVDSQGNAYDSYQTAVILSRVLREGGYDLILCGKQAIDGDNCQVVQMVAEMLGIPQVMVIEKLEIKDVMARVTRRIGGGSKEIYECALPLIVGCEKGLNQPRYASLPGIMKAKSKPVDKKNAQELLGKVGPLVRFASYELPLERSRCKMIEGEPAQQAAELVRLLREEAKVI